MKTKMEKVASIAVLKLALFNDIVPSPVLYDLLAIPAPLNNKMTTPPINIITVKIANIYAFTCKSKKKLSK